METKYTITITERQAKLLDWLKSLRPQNRWKPSKKQMKALDSVIDEYDGYPEFDSLVSLRNDLRNKILSFIDTLEVKESDETAEAFARIIRANLTGIDKDVQYKFEQLYKEITGKKMYQGYKD